MYFEYEYLNALCIDESNVFPTVVDSSKAFSGGVVAFQLKKEADIMNCFWHLGME